jgi:hypothetical protein
MTELHATLEQQTSPTRARFQEVIHPQVFVAPRIDWKQVDSKLTSYITTSAAGTPWVNRLALVLAVQTCYARLGQKVVSNTLLLSLVKSYPREFLEVSQSSTDQVVGILALPPSL